MSERQIPPKESCEMCKHYRFQFTHNCWVSGKKELCPPEVKCPIFEAIV